MVNYGRFFSQRPWYNRCPCGDEKIHNDKKSNPSQYIKDWTPNPSDVENLWPTGPFPKDPLADYYTKFEERKALSEIASSIASRNKSVGFIRASSVNQAIFESLKIWSPNYEMVKQSFKIKVNGLKMA